MYLVGISLYLLGECIVVELVKFVWLWYGRRGYFVVRGGYLELGVLD